MRSSVLVGGEAVHNKGMQLTINRVRASSHVQGRSATVGVMMRAAKGTARCVWACGCSQLMPRPLGRSMRRKNPYRLNVIGDFYVEDGCCTWCGVPEVEAPDLFETNTSNEQCYVKKQPQSAGETRRMIAAIAAQDTGCIRYAGRDPSILRELVSANEAGSCDALSTSRFGRIRSWLLRRRIP